MQFIIISVKGFIEIFPCFFRGWFKEKSIIIIVGFCARCYRFDFHYVPLYWRNGDRRLITITPTCYKCREIYALRDLRKGL